MSIATADCKVYEAFLKYGQYPCLSEGLTTALYKSLDDDPTDEQMYKIIENFGTHAVSKIEMGAKYISKSEFTQETTGSSETETTASGVALSAGFDAFSANVNTNNSNTDSSSNSNSSRNESSTDYSLGTPLPAGKDTKEKLNKWVSNVEAIRNTPAPIGKMELVMISDAIR
jgi:hypothetical protein